MNERDVIGDDADVFGSQMPKGLRVTVERRRS